MNIYDFPILWKQNMDKSLLIHVFVSPTPATVPGPISVQ